MAEQTEQSGAVVGSTAVKALAGAAATGAATYAVRKALASRNGHDEPERDDANGGSEDAQAAEEYATEDSADQDDQDSEDADEMAEEDEEKYEPESSAGEDDEDYEDEDPDESNGSGQSAGKGALRQLVNPSRLASFSHLLVPVAGEAADSAGRYVAEHTSEEVQQQVVERFIDAFEKAS